MSCSPSTSLHPLITQPLVDSKKYYCPFLTRGFCRNSARCDFSHDNHDSTKIPTDYCHFYLANKCFYGLDCKFRHSEPDDEVDNQQTSSSSFVIGTPPNLTCATSSSNLASTNNNNNNNNPEDTEAASPSDSFEDAVDNFHYCFYVHDSGEGSTLYHESCEAPNIDIDADADDDRDRADGVEDDDDNKSTIANNLDQPSNIEGNSVRSQSKRTISDANTASPKTATTSTTTTTTTSSSSSSKTKAWQNKKATQEALGLGGEKDHPLCPYSLASGECPFPLGQCNYLHGLVCDLCCRSCLHPYSETQRRQHRDECLREHEREMELSFAVQRSKDKVCGICMDIVVEKKPITSSRFGILEKCNHIFCLDCIRKWRGTKQFDNRTIRACPECRVSSDFVVPSKYWVEDQNDKEKLIGDYKAALSSKPCRYFDQGKGECPFAGSCFYKHAYPDGRIAEMEAPKPRRRLYGSRGPTSSVANYILWSILTSTDEDDWSADDLGSLNYGSDDEDQYPADNSFYDDFDWS